MAAAAVISISTGALAAPFFVGVGELPGMRTFSTMNGFDNVVSNDGTTVVGRAIHPGGNEAFRWTQAGGMQGLGDLPGGGFFSEAYSTSGDGSAVVGRSVSAFGIEAFRWTQAGGMQGLGTLGGGTLGSSEAHSVSADGSVVVGFGTSLSGRDEAFRWTQAGGMQGLGILGGGHLPSQTFSSQAWSTSADGSVVVGSSASPNSAVEAFRWTQAGGMQGLGNLPGGSFSSIALSTSADGEVVVGSSVSFNGTEAFRWTQAGGMQGLGALAGGGFNSQANSTSADGSVVVGRSTASGGGKAFLWDSINGMRALDDVLQADFGLDLTGWMLRDARGVSDDGLVVAGWGINPNGRQEAFIANMRQDVVVAVHEPGILVLFGLGLAGLGFARRKRA